MRRKLTAVVIAVLVFGLISASAASLGGIDEADLGASAEVVASCDTDGVDVDYTLVYDAANDQFDVTEVIVSQIAAPDCDGDAIYVEISALGAQEDFGSATIGSGTVTVPMTNLDASAEAIDEIAIYISETNTP